MRTIGEYRGPALLAMPTASVCKGFQRHCIRHSDWGWVGERWAMMKWRQWPQLLPSRMLPMQQSTACVMVLLLLHRPPGAIGSLPAGIGPFRPPSVNPHDHPSGGIDVPEIATHLAAVCKDDSAIRSI